MLYLERDEIHETPIYAVDDHREQRPTTSTAQRRQSAPASTTAAAAASNKGNEGKRRFSDFSIQRLLNKQEVVKEETTRASRKQRTIYAHQQTLILEKAFESARYMVGLEREVLAAQLGLSEGQVRVWFQNRRSKWRKQGKGSK